MDTQGFRRLLKSDASKRASANVLMSPLLTHFVRGCTHEHNICAKLYKDTWHMKTEQIVIGVSG